MIASQTTLQIIRAINSIRPLAHFSFPNDVFSMDDIDWHEEAQAKPTQAELNVALQSLAVKDLMTEVTKQVQDRLDEYAQTRGYDNILSACTYANSNVPQFAKEGQYAVDMRDAHWSKCYQIMNDVQTGKRPVPSVTEVLLEMPAWHWPD